MGREAFPAPKKGEAETAAFHLPALIWVHHYWEGEAQAMGEEVGIFNTCLLSQGGV